MPLNIDTHEAGLHNLNVLTGAEFYAFIKKEHLYNRCVESRFKCNDPARITWIAGTIDHKQYALMIAPVTCERGESVPFDPTSEYLNQVQYLGYHSLLTDETISKIISQAVISCHDGHQVLIQTCDTSLALLLSTLGFTRISGLRDRLNRFVTTITESSLAKPDTALQSPVMISDLKDCDRFYYRELKRLFAFDIRGLIQSGWTTYNRDNTEFLFTVTFGENKQLHQPAFKLDVFDSLTGRFVGYHDIHVPEGTDIAFSDLPLHEFPTVVPRAAEINRKKLSPIDKTAPNHVRYVWRNQDSLWVHPQYRHRGIGGTLVRIACDVVTYAFEGIRFMQVCVPFENPGVFRFHERYGAKQTTNGLYRLAYVLCDERPLIKITQQSA